MDRYPRVGTESKVHTCARAGALRGKGRCIIADARIDAGEVVVYADEPVACARVELGDVDEQRGHVCNCCLRFVGNIEAQLRELTAAQRQAPTSVFCSRTCRARARLSWSCAASSLDELCNVDAARQIGIELVLLSVKVMEAMPASALENPPLCEFHGAPYEKRGVVPNAADRQCMEACFSWLEAHWRTVTRGARPLEWMVDDFSRLLGILAMNALEVKVPNPACFELHDLTSGAYSEEERRARLSALAPYLRKLADLESTGGEESSGASESSEAAKDGTRSDEGSESAESDDEDEDEDEEMVFRVPLPGRGARMLSISSCKFPPATGVGIYSTVALLNHSCEPNCELAFLDADARASVVTTQEVGAGEELTISYINVNRSTAARQQELGERYGFNCSCRRCCSCPEI